MSAEIYANLFFLKEEQRGQMLAELETTRTDLPCSLALNSKPEPEVILGITIQLKEAFEMDGAGKDSDHAVQAREQCLSCPRLSACLFDAVVLNYDDTSTMMAGGTVPRQRRQARKRVGALVAQNAAAQRLSPAGRERLIGDTVFVHLMAEVNP